MIYGARQLAGSFRTVRKNTLIIAEEIPAEQYSFRPTPDVRSVGGLLSHIAVNTRWATLTHGGDARASFISFEAFGAAVARMAEEERALEARSKPEIVESLRAEGEAFAMLLEGLDDAVLAEMVGFPPPVTPSSKTRLEMLLSVKEHEMHHRAQLMLIERMLGIVPHLTRQRQAMAASRA
jgi:uncharacterized damage-inducible protein DinB